MTPTTNQALHVEPAGSPAPSPVGVTDDDAELTRLLGRARPDVVVVDDRMIDDRPLAAYGMDVRVIVMGMDDDRRFAERAERLGAVAWIPKEHADEFLPLLIGG